MDLPQASKVFAAITVTSRRGGIATDRLLVSSVTAPAFCEWKGRKMSKTFVGVRCFSLHYTCNIISPLLFEELKWGPKRIREAKKAEVIVPRPLRRQLPPRFTASQTRRLFYGIRFVAVNRLEDVRASGSVLSTILLASMQYRCSLRSPSVRLPQSAVCYATCLSITYMCSEK